MALSARLVMTMAAAASLWSSAALAETWAPAATSAAGDLFEIEVTTSVGEGDIRQTWERDTLARPAKDRATGKAYTTAIVRRWDDCARRRVRYSSMTLRDRNGQLVRTESGETEWEDVQPDTVSEAIWRTACRLGRPPPEKPILDDIAAGEWKPLGPSADGTYELSALLDSITSLDDDLVAVVSRQDYKKYEPVGDYYVAYVVNVYVVNCRKAEFGYLATDSYITPTVRAESARTTLRNVRYETIQPGTYLSLHYSELCAAARQEAAKAGDGAAQGQGATGTGWGVAKGYIVTASHVVADGGTITVYSDGQRIGEARVVADDPANDLAVLKLVTAGVRLQVLPLAERSANLGRSVFTLGYPAPDILGQRIKMTAGEVSATAGIQDDARYLQISVPIQPGNSGGPLIDWDGAVVGVIEAKLKGLDDEGSGPAPENVNYAMKAAYVRPMLEDLPDLGNYTVVHASGGPDEVVAAARRAVFMLVVTP